MRAQTQPNKSLSYRFVKYTTQENVLINYQYFKKEIVDMDQYNPNPENMVKTAVGVVGGGALLVPAAPIAIPVLQGLAGIAVVGLGIFAAGSLVVKAAGALKGIDNPLKAKEKSTTNS